MPFEPAMPEVDPTAADTGSLVELGVVDPPPVPAEEPPPEPGQPPENIA